MYGGLPVDDQDDREPTGPDDQSVPADSRYRLLSSERRRHALAVLLDAGGPLSLAELAHRVASREFETPDDGRRQRVYLSLYHAHVPLLEDAGVVTYDRESGAIEPTARADGLADYL